jgi:hypothetical protein
MITPAMLSCVEKIPPGIVLLHISSFILDFYDSGVESHDVIVQHGELNRG